MNTIHYLFIVSLLIFAVFFLFAGWKNIKLLLDDWDYIKSNKTGVGRFLYVAGFVGIAVLLSVLGFIFIYFLQIASSQAYLFSEYELEQKTLQ